MPVAFDQIMSSSIELSGISKQIHANLFEINKFFNLKKLDVDICTTIEQTQRKSPWISLCSNQCPSAKPGLPPLPTELQMKSADLTNLFVLGAALVLV